MSNIIISRFGAMASTGEKVRVMYADGGRYYKWPVGGIAIGKMIASVKFLRQPTGDFYQSKDANNSSDINEVHWLMHGQTYCKRSDDGAYVATACTPYVFPLNEWLDVTWYESLGGSYASITVTGYPGRSVGCANWMFQGPSVPYQHYIFPSGVKAYFRRLRTYGTNGVECNDWDFENGSGIAGEWSNCTIKEVRL